MSSSEKIEKIRERSAAYPTFDLEEAINRADNLHKSYGSGSYSREDAAKGMGYQGISGASARAIAALAQYNLVERNGNVYTLTTLANEILMPTSDNEKTQAITQAALSPKLFDTLYRTYSGQSLPNLLENIIFRQGVTRDASKEAAATFKRTMDFAGLLKNGVLVKFSHNNQEGETDLSNGAEPEDISSRELKTKFGLTEEGKGWSIQIKSIRPLTSKARKILIELVEVLDSQEENP